MCIATDTMTENNNSKALYELCELDKKIVVLTNQVQDIQKQSRQTQAIVGAEKRRLADLEKQLAAKKSQQANEEKSLKEEEKKILERRKQLAAMGGVKSAKVLGREIDIASRAMQTREENLIKVMEEVQALTKQAVAQKDKSEELDLEAQISAPSTEDKINELTAKLEKYRPERDEIYRSIDPVAVKLYERVQVKYPAGAVAKAVAGSCEGCFRSLPPQLYNEVLKGESIIQCPGCMRILVYLPDDVPGEEGPSE